MDDKDLLKSNELDDCAKENLAKQEKFNDSLTIEQEVESKMKDQDKILKMISNYKSAQKSKK